MEGVIRNKAILGVKEMKDYNSGATNLTKVKINKEYVIKKIKSSDEELKNFLFTLGCYEGERVTVLSVLSETYVISVKDARYSIDKDLAEAIVV